MIQTNFIILLLFFSFNLFGQVPRSMICELERLDVDRALLIPDVSIDYYPIWSPNNDYIGINISETWYKFDLSETTMVQADVRDEVIGYNSFGTLDSLKESEVEIWKTSTKHDLRKVTTSDGYTYELKMVGLRTTFIETDPNGNTKEHFTTSGENNHSLSLSPDEKFIAFIAELNGLMIFVRDKKDLKTTVSDDEKDVSIVLNLLDNDENAKAQKLLEKIIKKSPQNDEAYFLLSQVMYSGTNLDECLKMALKAVELAPAKSSYLFWISEIYSAKGDYLKAINSLKSYLSHKPTKYGIYYDIAKLFLANKDNDNACKYYHLIQSYYPNYSDQEFDTICE